MPDDPVKSSEKNRLQSFKSSSNSTVAVGNTFMCSEVTFHISDFTCVLLLYAAHGFVKNSRVNTLNSNKIDV